MVIERVLSNMSLHSLRNASTKIVKKVEKAGLIGVKDVKKATILYNYGLKRSWIEDYLLLLHLEFHL